MTRLQVRDDAEQEPHWLIGLECDSAVEEAIQATGQVETDTAPDEQPVDICLVEEGQTGISHYFIHQLKPFYKRRWADGQREIPPLYRAANDTRAVACVCPEYAPGDHRDVAVATAG